METWDIRAYQRGDESSVVSVWNTTMVADPIGSHRFRQKVLLDPNFDPENCLVADSGGRICGFILSLVRRVPYFGQGSEPEDAWITAFGVDPAFQRQGIGSALLKTAIDKLRASGRKRVSIAPYVPNYFIPGVDVSAYAAAVIFLQHRDFNVVSRPLSMRAELTSFQSPAAVRQRHQMLAMRNIEIRPAIGDDITPVLEFIPTHFSWDWHREAAGVLSDLFAGDPKQVGMIVAIREGEVLGYAQHRNERFGPFGVHPDQRSQGIGRVLLATTLTEMLKRELHAAWFLWTSDDAARLYAQLGFREVRRFAVMERSL